MTFLGLVCEACGHSSDAALSSVCAECWGPLEPTYDWDAVADGLKQRPLAGRPCDLARYRELLPLPPDTAVRAGVGWTPLLPVPRLGRRLGIADLRLKYDAACHPTLSFKDRLVTVALARAASLGLTTVGCSSTGNLAVALAAGAAAAGLEAVLFVPHGVETAKLQAAAVYGATLVGVRGDYDHASRLSVEVADRFGWGIVNVNLRPYYAEAGKTVGFEIAEQCGFTFPGHVVVPVAGGGLLCKIDQAFRESARAGLAPETPYRMYAVQPEGCAPVVNAWDQGTETIRPVKARTRVQALAVGDPGDGPRALAVMKRTGGSATAPTDDEAAEGVRHLAEDEGLNVELAGGLVVAAARRLAERGAFADGRPVVLVMTGSGFKAPEPGPDPLAVTLGGSLADFEGYWKTVTASRGGAPPSIAR